MTDVMQTDHVNALAAVLGDALARSNRTQQDLAEHLDVSQSTVSRWLAGSAPRSGRWVAIEQYLDLPPNAIAGAVGAIADGDADPLAGLPPTAIRAAKDLAALPPDVRRDICALIRRLVDTAATGD